MNPWTDSGYKSLGEVQRSEHLRVPITLHFRSKEAKP
jgi:hypothetical protein